MKQRIFIQENKKQMLGALVAKYALLREQKGQEKIPVEILNVDEMPLFEKYSSATFKKHTEEMRFHKDDLQFFTLTRFLPPEKMNYEGCAVVIDPDIFALTDIHELFNTDMKGHAILACRKRKAWDSSVMLLDCSKLRHWKIEEMLQKLSEGKLDYLSLITLERETSVGEIPPEWNSLDRLTPQTKMLHTTMRLTQPWKTGLPIDFRRNRMPKIWGLIPREPFHKLLGIYPTHYKKHPDQSIEDFFFRLSSEALRDGAVTKEEIEHEVKEGHVRKDFFTVLQKFQETQ